jgi:microcystin-dependent protein
MTEMPVQEDRYDAAVKLLEKKCHELDAKIEEVEKIKTALSIADGWRKLTEVQIPALSYDLRSHIDDLLVGSVTAFAMPTPPPGWLLCNGEAVSREKYPKLFQCLQSTHGEGDGSQTFNLPDLRGKFLRGYDPEETFDSGRSFGSYQEDQIQSHSHSDAGHSHGGSTSSEGNHSHSADTGLAGNHSHRGTVEEAGKHSHYYMYDKFKGVGAEVIGFTEEHPILGSIAGANSPKILYAFEGDIPGIRYWSRKGYPRTSIQTHHAGTHNHSVEINSVDPHFHNISIDSTGSHSHSVNINDGTTNLGNPIKARHGSETRVKNIALIYCIKY